MEIRNAKIISGSCGGTSSANAKTYKLALPTSWVKTMGLDTGGHNVELNFDGTSIRITPKLSVGQFFDLKQKLGHTLKRICFYNDSDLCTEILADFTDTTVAVQNHVDDFAKTAFGNNVLPTWNDLNLFLQERCISRDRDGIREYLEAICVSEYDPWRIVEATKGRMAEDNQWLTIENV